MGEFRREKGLMRSQIKEYFFSLWSYVLSVATTTTTTNDDDDAKCLQLVHVTHRDDSLQSLDDIVGQGYVS